MADGSLLPAPPPAEGNKKKRGGSNCGPGGGGVDATTGHVAGFTCFSCRVAKVKCDKEWPCGRCTTFELECVSQGRGPGRPPAKNKPVRQKRAYMWRRPPTHQPPTAATPVVSSAAASSSSSSAAGVGAGAGAGALAGVSVSPLPPLPPTPSPMSLMPLALPWQQDGQGVSGSIAVESERRGRKQKARGGSSSGDGTDGSMGERSLEDFPRAQKVQRRMRTSRFPVPERLAELMTGALSRALDARVVDDRKALAVLRLWSLCAFTQGRDFTWGLLNNASLLLERSGFQPQATKDFVFYGPAPEEALTIQDPKFGWREIPEALRLLDDGGVSAISSYVFIDGVFRLYANQTFSDMFMTPYELNARMAEEQIMPVFLWTRCVPGEDKQAFVELMISVAYTQSANAGEASRVLNALDRNGQSVPCLVRVRYVYLNQGNYCAMVVSFFPLPTAALAGGPSAISARSISITANRGANNLSSTSDQRTPALPARHVEGTPRSATAAAAAAPPPLLPPVREEESFDGGGKLAAGEEEGEGEGGPGEFEAVLAALDTPALALHPDNSLDDFENGGGRGRPGRADSTRSGSGASYASYSSASASASASASSGGGCIHQHQHPPDEEAAEGEDEEDVEEVTAYYLNSLASSSPAPPTLALQRGGFPPGSEALLSSSSSSSMRRGQPLGGYPSLGGEGGPVKGPRGEGGCEGQEVPPLVLIDTELPALETLDAFLFGDG